MSDLAEMLDRAARAWNEHARGSQGAGWDELDETERAYWRTAAQKAIEATGLLAGVAALMAEHDAAQEELARLRGDD